MTLRNSAVALSFALSLFAIGPTKAAGQTPQPANAGAILSQLNTAISGGQAIQQVQLTGTATWNAGGLLDSGTASLTASTNGSSQLQLTLAASGQRTETQTGTGSSADCQWAGADGVANEVAVGNCWKPSLWFFPALSLQPSALPTYLGVVDLGSGAVGSGPNLYRHLQCQLGFAIIPSALATSVAAQSVSDLGLDPETLLPAVLSYSILPDSGPPTPIAIEIHYSNYQTVNGVQIPFLIQRYVNGSLQLSIAVASAQIG